MQYILVLQWPATSIKDYDSLIEIENLIIKHLSPVHEVDGHDFGSGEANIFIFTSDPQQAFNEIKTIIGSLDYWNSIRVAFRGTESDEYTALWPKDLKKFQVI
jgi:hypothetical protein